MSQKLNGALLLLFVVLALLLIVAYIFVVPAEDAVVLYEYSKNVANRGIITYGSGTSAPIEGATDFLWMLVIGLFLKLGFNAYLSALIFNFMGAILIAPILNKLKIAPWLIFVSIVGTPYLYSSLSGFSTLLFSAAYLFCLYLAMKKNKNIYLFLFFLCLFRPDGVVWGAGIILFRFLDYKNIDFKVEISRFIWFLVIPGITFFIWRSWYFGELLPLPFIVKSGGSRDLLFFNKDSLWALGLVLKPLIFTLFFLEDKKRFIIKLALLFTLPCLFYSAMHLEQNVGNRFVAPMFFGLLALLGTQKLFLTKLIFVVFSVLFSLSTTIVTALGLIDAQNENIYPISLNLQKMKGKMLTTEAGRLAYYSDWDVDDSWGLNTPRYAHRLISNNDLHQGSYDLIVAHCDLNLLDGARTFTGDLSRSWENQCKILTSYIHRSEYDVILVPFYAGHSISQSIRGHFQFDLSTNKLHCARYDIYAISKHFPSSQQLKILLLQYGGIPYAKHYTISGDSVCLPKE